jgi:hypothetical protein
VVALKQQVTVSWWQPLHACQRAAEVAVLLLWDGLVQPGVSAAASPRSARQLQLSVPLPCSCSCPQAVRQVWENDARARKALANRAHTLKSCLLQSSLVLKQAKQGERWVGGCRGRSDVAGLAGTCWDG